MTLHTHKQFTLLSFPFLDPYNFTDARPLSTTTLWCLFTLHSETNHDKNTLTVARNALGNNAPKDMKIAKSYLFTAKSLFTVVSSYRYRWLRPLTILLLSKMLCVDLHFSRNVSAHKIVDD